MPFCLVLLWSIDNEFGYKLYGSDSTHHLVKLVILEGSLVLLLLLILPLLLLLGIFKLRGVCHIATGVKIITISTISKIAFLYIIIG